MARTILIAAGGTGGHLFPGIAVADELVRRDPATRVVFAGTPRGLESRLVPRAGYELELLPILPLNAVGPGRLLLGLLVLPWAMLRALALVVRLRPAAVLGIGGYAGGPVTLLAASLGVRTVILEPNARPGFTNRMLKPFVRRAACAYEEARSWFGKKGVVTGNPVRRGFTRLPRREHRPPLTLLAFGGSQGSRVLNRAMVAALPHLPGEERLRIVHQTGERMLAEVTAAYDASARGAEVVAFLDDMAERMAGADLVLSRSGATTCAELTVGGRAALLVPFARAADDHQRTNAKALEDAGAARMIEETDLTGEALAREITALVDEPSRIGAMEEAARRLGRPDAAARVADLVLGDAPTGVATC
ncbi:MAG: undecaprenyldiphospho-muramoylpentapeptide beta-N-acetylglucosaminyltransferase [Acidobacteria bacterium]|jgi:UDP-N-acetylglucosamine--N-acetylmuramyl-(pentapeptide) pyrophosphoryl-undecaprenol N-acetylglucosamine transferase|nr:undecaprenyldiphospho-muramoylpentapeptide beta-N-acetylglucosaminyltransferase [Acidobacteriota bacterium]